MQSSFEELESSNKGFLESFYYYHQDLENEFDKAQKITMDMNKIIHTIDDSWSYSDFHPYDEVA